MQVTNEKFIVLDVVGVSGLLVSDYVYKPGRIFYKGEWKWGDKTLEVAIKNGRCKLYEEIKAVKVETSINVEKSTKQKRLEALYEDYASIDSESDKAKKLEEKIKKLEAEIAEDEAK